MTTLTPQGVPNFNTPFLDKNGQIAFAWYQFFINLWNRTGGGLPSGNVTNVSANGVDGIIASVANPNTTPVIDLSLNGSSVTAILSAFSSLNKGVVPASAGGTTNFLRADGSWVAPFGFTTAGALTSTSYVSALDEGGNPIKILVA